MIIIPILHNSYGNYNTGERNVEHLPNNQLQFCKNTINHSYLYLNICQHFSQGLNCSHLKVITLIMGWHRFRIKVRDYCKLKIHTKVVKDLCKKKVHWWLVHKSNLLSSIRIPKFWLTCMMNWKFFNYETPYN